MKNTHIKFAMIIAGTLVSAISLYAPDVLERRYFDVGTGTPIRQYIQETAEDIKEALVNIPERVPVGPEIETLRGRQITLSDMPQDNRRNRQIYNDIAELQIEINRAIRVILDRQKRPILQNQVVEVELKELLDLLGIAGIRYNQVANFTLFRQRVIELRQDLRDSYNAYEIANPNNYYMTIRFKLETLSSEIENLLKTLILR